jgi:ABC-type amino acid transport substrate-binding protein
VDESRLVRTLSRVDHLGEPDPAFLDRLYEDAIAEVGLGKGTRRRPTRQIGLVHEQGHFVRTALLLAAAVALGSALLASGAVGSWVARFVGPREPANLLEQVRATSVLRVAITPPPSGTTTMTPAIAGFDEAVAHELAARLGVRVEVVRPASLSQSTAWAVALPTAPAWSIDQDAFESTRPFYAWPRQVLVASTSTARSLADVEGQAICAVAGDGGQHWLLGSFGPGAQNYRTTPPIVSTLIVRDDDEACLAELATGRVAAIVSAALSPSDIVARSDLHSVFELPREPRAIVVSRQGSDPGPLRAVIEQILDQMDRDGTTLGLTTTSFGADLSVLGQ